MQISNEWCEENVKEEVFRVPGIGFNNLSYRSLLKCHSYFGCHTIIQMFVIRCSGFVVRCLSIVHS